MEGGGGGSCDDDHQHLLLLHHLIMSEDVLIQILLCLPAISLLRFKSVCKSWHSIIESPFFINLHAITTKSGGTSFFFKQEGDEHQEKEKICMLSGDEFEVFEDLGRPPLIDLGEKELEAALKRTYHEGKVKFNVVGCCNGIICLHDCFTRNVVLWNPAIKQSRRLPKPSNLLGNPNCNDDGNGNYAEDVIAFGVDAKTKDYKLLLITTLEPQETYFGTSHSDEQQRLMHSHSPRPRRVHVYNLSTDSWRCIDITLSDAHPYLQIDIYVTQGVYLNGSHFFITSCLIKVEEYFCTRPLILSLDLTEEIFKTVPPPYDWWNKFHRITCGTGWNKFIPFGEKLALVEGFPNECNVWVLNVGQHSGVKESWTKLYNLVYSSFISPENGLQYIANNGQFVIRIDPSNYQEGVHVRKFHILNLGSNYQGVRVRKFHILNLITGETKDLKSDCQGLQLFDYCGIYRPSLVQISRSDRCNK